MNLLDAYVMEVLGEPEAKFGRWWVEVKADCYGSPITTELMFDTEDEAKAVSKGHHFLT